MAISKINTTEVESVAKDLYSIASEFNSEIDSLFKRLSDVPTVTKEWTGKESSYYFDRIYKDRKLYTDFGSCLTNIAIKLQKDVAEIQNTVKKNENEESRKN